MIDDCLRGRPTIVYAAYHARYALWKDLHKAFHGRVQPMTCVDGEQVGIPTVVYAPQAEAFHCLVLSMVSVDGQPVGILTVVYVSQAEALHGIVLSVTCVHGE